MAYQDVGTDSGSSGGTTDTAKEQAGRLDELVAGAAGDEDERHAGPVQVEQRPGRRVRRRAVHGGEEVAARTDHRAVEVGVDDPGCHPASLARYSATVFSGGRSRGVRSTDRTM